MKTGLAGQLFNKWNVLVMTLLIGVFLHSSAYAFNLRVVEPVRDTAGNITSYKPIASSFRWLLEEDTTIPVRPGVPVTEPLSVQVQNGHAPVVSKGHSADATTTIARPRPIRYFVSVLPDSGYTHSGANVPVGKENITVIVNPHPVPTAQVSVLVFNDNNPINAAPDLTEQGLAGFNVLILDQLGQMAQDAFGNPLGTTYVQTCGTNGNDFCLDAEENPIPDVVGTGVLTTDLNGRVDIKYINPGKYGIRISPPIGTPWVQTNTIEGTPGIDAWVKANEPKLLVEFGPLFFHASFGFVDPTQFPWALAIPPLPPDDPLLVPTTAAYGTITGSVVNNHFSPPPGFQANPGHPVPNCYVGLNDTTLVPTTAVPSQGLYVAACNPDSTFTIPNVPPGTYQLVMWDKPLDYIFNFTTVNVPRSGGLIDLGQVLMQAWFGALKGKVFQDPNENGFRDDGEAGIADMVVNLRFRDGSIYQSTATDPNGDYSLIEIFPFMRWLVAEVDYGRFKATGATIAVDAGGPIPNLDSDPLNNSWVIPAFDRLNPQPQAEVNPFTGNNLSRVEPGVTLLEGLMVFAGMTNVIDWGKNAYAAGEKGDLTGVVYYATTRAENDSRYDAADPWEPGIPRVQVNLYTDADGGQKIDDRNGNGRIDLADVDNYPLGNFPGPGDIDRNANGVFDFGDAVNVAWTDSWDDNKPTGCIQHLPVVHGRQAEPCFDGFYTLNQVRPALFDGGYAFGSIFPAGPRGPEVSPIPSGYYIVEAVPPRGYEIVKEEDKNVDFGDAMTPSKLLLPPVCVGELHHVPLQLALFPGVDIDPAFAGKDIPLCDRKWVSIEDGRNTAADFFMFTEVPKAGRISGLITNDLAAAFFIGDPNFGEKAGPAFIPISIRDYAGNELVRTYSDEFGGYNTLVPSTFTVNAPIPTGVSPNMLNVCLNHPGPIPDPNNPARMIQDPFFNPNYTQNCFAFDFWPAKTTILDTPLLPVSAFAVGVAVVDINPDAGTPVIASVAGPQRGACAEANNVVVIRSMGTQRVPNPAYDPTILNSAQIITRDFGFGNRRGTVTINGTAIPNANILLWSNGVIRVRIPAGATGGELLVTRGDNGRTTQVGVNLHIEAAGGCAAAIHVASGESIQAAIDAAATANALILVDPGIYHENLIISKNVRLQGSGAGRTIIEANPGIQSARSQAWEDFIANLIQPVPNGPLDPNGFLLPGQDLTTFTLIDSTPGIIVLVPTGTFTSTTAGLIDGFTIRGTTNGGGILVNGNAPFMEISNNRVTNNIGNLGGGVRVGFLGADGNNDDLYVHHNEIVSNGSFNGGGGVSIYAGADNYRVTDNFIVGNISPANGGGILHEGLSDNARIERNKIAFNEVFSDQLSRGNGGGIFVTGGTIGLVRYGSGDVTINSNQIQGNLAGAGQGGGIRAFAVNSEDLVANPGTPSSWYALNIFNNIIVDNVATNGGGGIALNQAARCSIVNNTIAHNDSTSTARLAFPPGNLNESVPQPAGIISTANNQAFAEASGQLFSDPLLLNNIIWQNRSFFFTADVGTGLPGLLPAPQHSSGTFTNATYWDLDVISAPDALVEGPTELNALKLNPDYSLLTSLIGPLGDDFTNGGTDLTNLAQDPKFVKPYFNELFTAVAADEAGTFVNVLFRPLTLSAGDYHIASSSPAVDAGADVATLGFSELATDFDADVRPNPDTGLVDIGADEVVTTTPPGTRIILLRPNGGEAIPANSTFDITWTAPENATRFNLFFSQDNGVTWKLINTGGRVPGFSLSWTVPTPLNNLRQYRIRIVGFDVNGNIVGVDRSDRPFTIEVVRLDSPNGGTFWTSGTTQTVFWTANDTKRPVAKVRLLITLNGGLSWRRLEHLVTDNPDPVPDVFSTDDLTGAFTVASSHSIGVKVPTVASVKTRSLIRVVLLDSAGRVVGSDSSNGFFTVLPAP